jgi:hypothetical protein
MRLKSELVERLWIVKDSLYKVAFLALHYNGWAIPRQVNQIFSIQIPE